MTTLIELKGTIAQKKPRFANTSDDFYIFDLEEKDGRITTCLGVVPGFAPGLEVEFQGEWKQSKWGQQFSIVSMKIPVPTSEAGIIAYLQTLKGVGPTMANKIWLKFGDQALDILGSDPNQYLQISGISEKILQKMIKGHAALGPMQDVIQFLAPLGVSMKGAVSVFKEYGASAIAKIKKNPYLLARQVRGFGFSKADEVAMNLGIAVDDIKRITAGVEHIVHEQCIAGGHAYLTYHDLLQKTRKVLERPQFVPTEDMIATAVAQLSRKEGAVVIDYDGNKLPRIYPDHLYQAETELAEAIKRCAGRLQKPGQIDLDQWIKDFCQRRGISDLAYKQRQALELFLTNGLIIITGGPGTGKTLTCRAITELAEEFGLTVQALAPTGKAARRLAQSIGQEASTIHRGIGLGGAGMLPTKDLSGRVILGDEMSMTELTLANAFFSAVRNNQRIVLLGDVNQLPSVGPGQVLHDLIESDVIPVVRLDVVQRQAQGSKIIQVYERLVNGQDPSFLLGQVSPNAPLPTSDAWLLECEPIEIKEKMRWLITEVLPKLGYTNNDIQTLAPQRKGEAGITALNEFLQTVFNPFPKAEYNGFHVNDRVMQISNDADRNVFNGDVGTVVSVHPDDEIIKVAFPQEDYTLTVTYDDSQQGELVPAWCYSIHKSQGSEYRAVILPIAREFAFMLNRRLMLTAATRAKKLLIFVGDPSALELAAHKKAPLRNSALIQRLHSGLNLIPDEVIEIPPAPTVKDYKPALRNEPTNYDEIPF